MKELLSFIIKNLVDKSADIQINEQTAGNHIELQVHVDKKDRGKIIGKQGRVINAVRTIVTAAASKTKSRVSVEVRD